jgi:response regulator RpfG family c-di-GMP phosphodiesterase
MAAPSEFGLIARLFVDGHISSEQQQAAEDHAARTGEREEEALLLTEAIDEQVLLRYLGTLHRTRFVSTAKLAKAEIDPAVIGRLSRAVAEREGVFPVLFDEATGVLSVVTADPSHADALERVRSATGAKGVRAFVARPRAVSAAINRVYGGDIHAFSLLDRGAQRQLVDMLDVFERHLVTEDGLASATLPKAQRVHELDAPEPPVSVTPPPAIPVEAYLETLNVLVTLLESTRTDLRGHSSHVARLVRQVSERLGLRSAERAAIVAAAYLHDLGKSGAYHLTAFNVSEYEGHRASAQKLHDSPLRLMETVELLDGVEQIIGSMYERFDGKGLPAGSSGKEIPVGARLLAIVDTYADLTQNPRNPQRKALSPAEAFDVIERFSGSTFDPNLVHLCRHAMTGEDLKAKLLSSRHRALIVDADPEETTVLELRMLEQGFEVKLARTSDDAIRILGAEEIDLVCSELHLKPMDGISLLRHARGQPWGAELPWVFVSSSAGRADAQKAFELGATDVMAKPVSTDLLVTKLKQLLERRAGGARTQGVSGSLSEMGLPDMVQVLWHGKKTGCLRIRSGPRTGAIHFVAGAIHNATFAGFEGTDAIYEMLALESGEFALEPSTEATERHIHESPEAILLEGMRRLDERGR